jgi:hypothetical protein
MCVSDYQYKYNKIKAKMEFCFVSYIIHQMVKFVLFFPFPLYELHISKL